MHVLVFKLGISVSPQHFGLKKKLTDRVKTARCGEKIYIYGKARCEIKKNYVHEISILIERDDI